MSKPVGSDVVCISLPQRDESAKLVRLTTTGVAGRAGLNLDQADDLNTALDELFRLYLAEPEPSADFCVRYAIMPGSLEVVAEGVSHDLFDESSKISRYSRFILERVADRLEEVPSPRGGFDVVITKKTTV